MAKESAFLTGEWVKGKSKDGELIHGFLETVEASQGIVKVRVVQSDNEESVGKTLELRMNWVEKLPVAEVQTEQQILSLIDLALATRDKKWFAELTDRLQQLPKIGTHAGTGDEGTRTARNRLGMRHSL
ncbi:MAG: IDEAL domain-containing protein [Clostridia bacterium]